MNTELLLKSHVHTSYIVRDLSLLESQFIILLHVLKENYGFQ